PYLLNLPPEK
nr:RecName: Full=Unknown protein 8 from 2D-PAGE [Fructilactobacillus sanfranciscensis]